MTKEKKAKCRNCGVEMPLSELKKVGTGMYRRWTGLWSCVNRYRCRKQQDELMRRVRASEKRRDEREDRRQKKVWEEFDRDRAR